MFDIFDLSIFSAMGKLYPVARRPMLTLHAHALGPWYDCYQSLCRWSRDQAGDHQGARGQVQGGQLARRDHMFAVGQGPWPRREYVLVGCIVP